MSSKAKGVITETDRARRKRPGRVWRGMLIKIMDVGHLVALMLCCLEGQMELIPVQPNRRPIRTYVCMYVYLVLTQISLDTDRNIYLRYEQTNEH